MMLIDYFKGKSNEEITNRLIILDKSIMDLHKSGLFVVGDLSEINIDNDEITMASFKNKVDYINSGFNDKGIKKDIIELCCVGICAYNRFEKIHTSKDFISYLIDNLDMYLENSKMPNYMKEYYIDVLLRGNVEYLNDFLLNYDNVGKENTKGMVYNKSTAVGRALTNDDAAYVRVMLIPSIMVLIFIVFIVSYMIFMR